MRDKIHFHNVFSSLLNLGSSFSVLGHEAVVEVIENKREKSDVKVGDRVTFSIVNTCQGKCVNCKLQLPQKCKQMTKVRVLFAHSVRVVVHVLSGSLSKQTCRQGICREFAGEN